jgi:hypothetical protein
MPDTLRYIKSDYSSQRDALIQRIRSRYPGSWNDFSNGSFGTLIIDAVAWAMANNAFTSNRLAGENFVSTMTLRESAVRLASLTNYKLKGPAPATVSCSAALISAAPGLLTVYQGTPVRTNDANLVFEVAKDYTIAEGDLTPLRTVAQFNPTTSGTGVIQSLVQVTLNSTSVDVLDASVDLTELVEAGQFFRLSDGSPEYEIVSIEAAPGSSSKNRMVFDVPYNEATQSTTAEVVDRNILLVQGQTITERFTTSAITTTGYVVELSKTPVIDNSVSVVINGTEWDEVRSLFLAQPDEHVYEVSTLSTGKTIVRFGDDVFGQTVPTEAQVEIEYRAGGGTVGNVPAGAINTSVIGLVTSLSNPINVQLENRLPGQGGLDQETLEEARVNIPAYTRTNDRAVTLSDYQTLASGFSDPQSGQVRYARATIRSENANLEGNVVVVYAWTTGSEGSLVPVRGGLKAALLSYLQEKAVGTDYVVLADGETQPLPVALRFKVLPGYEVSQVSDTIEETIRSFVNQLRPGSPVIYSDFVRLLDEVTGVDSLILATPTTDLYPITSDRLFVAPDATYDYSLSLQTGVDADGVDVYTAGLPVFPLTAWSFSLSLGDAQLSVLPDVTPGFARVSGTGLSTDSDRESTVNLLTGAVSLYPTGVPGDLKLRLIPVQGYERERTVNLYVGYRAQGDSAIKRREIRAALQAWVSGFPPGSTLFTERVTGIAASAANVTDVVAAVTGVTEVTRVSLDTASNSAVRLDAGQAEIFRFGSIYLNNLSS